MSVRVGVGGSKDPISHGHKARWPTSSEDVDYLPFRIAVTPSSRTEGRPGHRTPRLGRVTPESPYSVSTLPPLPLGSPVLPH